jgi:creatinine amidohydrolase
MNDELGIVEPENEGFHDSLWITALMMIVDPASVRYDERVAAGKATINGSSIAPKEKRSSWGRS